jgi:membrane protease YdiL (CAAX protease family)
VAKSGADRRQTTVPAPTGYFAWSRDPAVGLFAVLPLWLLYEGLRLSLTPEERNGAEQMIVLALGMLGGAGLMALRAVFAVCVLAAAVSLMRRRVPWMRVAAVAILESAVYGLLLGPLAGALAAPVQRALAAGHLSQVMVGSLGAGLFEELVFRLVLMTALVWLGVRVAQGFSLPRQVGAGAAVVLSAVVFSAFHHFCGEPFTQAAFLFRTAAGLLLGILMWFRGFGVCVYTHAAYDVHYYLTH